MDFVAPCTAVGTSGATNWQLQSERCYSGATETRPPVCQSPTAVRALDSPVKSYRVFACFGVNVVASANLEYRSP